MPMDTPTVVLLYVIGVAGCLFVAGAIVAASLLLRHRRRVRHVDDRLSFFVRYAALVGSSEAIDAQLKDGGLDDVLRNARMYARTVTVGDLVGSDAPLAAVSEAFARRWVPHGTSETQEQTAFEAAREANENRPPNGK
jgi:hypothetical protein